MADKGEKDDAKGTGEEKPKKTYVLKGRPKGLKLCATCKKPLTSEADEVCGPCALAAAQAKAAAGEAGKGPEPEKKEAPQEPEPNMLDVMKEILAEVERQNIEDDQIAKEVKEKFSIKDVGSANWAAGKIAMWQNEIERRKAQAKDFIAEAERNVRRLKFLFMAQLEEWAKRNMPQDKKSLKLPLATLKFSDTQDKIEVVDEQKAVAWATVNCSDAVQMGVSLQMLKDVWLKSEKKVVPDGCVEIPKETRFEVR
jgi:hypothetical protein